MEKELIGMLGKYGLGAVGFYLAYILIKFMMERMAKGMDDISDSLKTHNEKTIEEHTKLMDTGVHITESLTEITSQLKAMNGRDRHD